MEISKEVELAEKIIKVYKDRLKFEVENEWFDVLFRVLNDELFLEKGVEEEELKKITKQILEDKILFLEQCLQRVKDERDEALEKIKQHKQLEMQTET